MSRLHVGDQAKAFDTLDYLGNPISLEQYRGKSLLLSFYRYASCPFCNLRVHQISEQAERLSKLGLSIVAVFQSPVSNIIKYVGKQNPPFPIIADPECKLYQDYGVEASLAGFLKGSATRIAEFGSAAMKGYHIGKPDGIVTRIPADFLINGDLIIKQAYYGTDIGDHIPLVDVESWLMS